ncbi:ThiF family adenylyltransferase [Burkholderia gladioli]|uniref:ThiF family adenylyltransferase n=1 Tax=Burkholderia gladioli TaxID=28095 RepID=UPI0019071528|nr:ThiF family adenylyltransferase [Burkholderia gladioli]MBJ9664118.1 Mov34/MPN/PAD-1 family protein [Burkholderia gladioli]
MSPLIQGAIDLIAVHHAVEARTVTEAADGIVEVRAQFRVDLPSRSKAEGESRNGVRAVEEVLFCFAPDFPTSAPRITLREDFPSTFPHIYRHKKGERVPPCITVGDKRDVMHSDGVYRLADQVSDWLDKAATGELAQNDLGWEPSRREIGSDFLDLASDEVAKTPAFGGWRLYQCRSMWTKDGGSSIAKHAQLVAKIRVPSFIRTIPDHLKYNQHVWVGDVPLLIFWPQAGDDGLPAVNSQYKVDTITTFAELATQAEEWKCRVALDDFISNFNRAWVQPKSTCEVIVYMAFPVRRPKNIIGLEAEFELMVYRMPFALGATLSTTATTAVKPVAIIEPISPKLLRRTSRLREEAAKLTLTFLGCGSLGSKALMHVARAGVSIGLLVDGKDVASHNVARHALFPEDTGNLVGKAERLADIIKGFGESRPKIHVGDIRDLDFEAPKCREFFNADDTLVVNTTGSSAVRTYLSAAPFQARVMESALLNHGDAAFMTLEGPGRCPSTLDLVHHAYEQLRPLGVLSVQDDEKSNVLEIGVGCQSVTIPMPDARVSLIAAGVGQKLLQLQQDGLPESGVAAVATVGADGMSINWKVESVGPTHIARVYDGENWSVRILDTAHQKIVADVRGYPDVETGGLIVGRVSTLTREVFITDVLPAAPDSTRSATRFVHGTSGTEASIGAYEALGGKTLSCIGTWHSHLTVSGPSQMDKDTAKKLEGKLRGAAVLLIRHPEGYAAVVRDGAPS